MTPLRPPFSQCVKTLNIGDHQRERSQSVSVCTLLVQWSNMQPSFTGTPSALVWLVEPAKGCHSWNGCRQLMVAVDVA